MGVALAGTLGFFCLLVAVVRGAGTGRTAAVLVGFVALGSMRAAHVPSPAVIARDDPLLFRLRLVETPLDDAPAAELVGVWSGLPAVTPVPFRPGRAVLHAPARELADLGVGSTLLVRARARRWRESLGLWAVAGAPVVVEQRRSHSGLRSALRSVREHVARGLGRTAPAELHGLFAALVLGDRSGLEPAVREQFARTGTAHLLAISGLHVGACMLLFWRFAARMAGYLPARWTASGLPARLGAPVGLAAAALYVAVAGLPVSGRRALVMAAVVAVAALMGRRVSPWNALAAACVLVLWAAPESLRSVGFQLSVVSVAGLLAWAHWTPPLGAGRVAGAARWVWGLIWTGVIGTLVTAPIVAVVWGRVPIAGLWANIVAVPLLGVATVPPLLVGALLAAVEPVLGAPFIWCASLGARLGLGAMARLAEPAVAPNVLWAPPPVAVGVLYLLVGGAVLAGRDR